MIFYKTEKTPKILIKMSYSIMINNKEQIMHMRDNKNFNTAVEMFRLFDDSRINLPESRTALFEMGTDFQVTFYRDGTQRCRWNSFMFACFLKNYELIFGLINKNPNFDDEYKFGEQYITPLSAICANYDSNSENDLKILSLFINMGEYDVDKLDINGVPLISKSMKYLIAGMEPVKPTKFNMYYSITINGKKQTIGNYDNENFTKAVEMFRLFDDSRIDLHESHRALSQIDNDFEIVFYWNSSHFCSWNAFMFGCFLKKYEIIFPLIGKNLDFNDEYPFGTMEYITPFSAICADYDFNSENDFKILSLFIAMGRYDINQLDNHGVSMIDEAVRRLILKRTSEISTEQEEFVN